MNFNNTDIKSLTTFTAIETNNGYNGVAFMLQNKSNKEFLILSITNVSQREQHPNEEISIYVSHDQKFVPPLDTTLHIWTNETTTTARGVTGGKKKRYPEPPPIVNTSAEKGQWTQEEVKISVEKGARFIFTFTFKQPIRLKANQKMTVIIGQPGTQYKDPDENHRRKTCVLKENDDLAIWLGPGIRSCNNGVVSFYDLNRCYCGTVSYVPYQVSIFTDYQHFARIYAKHPSDCTIVLGK